MAKKMLTRSQTASFGAVVAGVVAAARSDDMTASLTTPSRPATIPEGGPVVAAITQAQGNTSEAITVGMRLRPLVGYELQMGQEHCIKIQDNVVSVVGAVTGGSSQDFAFDFAMDSTSPGNPNHCDQSQCYEKMGRRMLNHMLNGYHTCLFCYGQTGTGKTTTIMGKKDPPSEQGLLLRLIYDIYDEVQRQKAQGMTVTVRVMMLEVYNERLNDLLCDPANRKNKKLDVRVHPEIGVYVLNATEELCESAEDCLKLIEFGNTMKTVAATAMNAQSSRGHTVFKLIFERRGGADSQITTSEVYFADLAGGENEKKTQVTGDRLQELTFINRSLMWLASCINSLGGRDAGRRGTVGGGQLDGKAKRDMSKFRNSKLTLLLSNALSGNSKTAMIGTLSPALQNFDESFSTLKFAKTVKNIKLEAKAATAVDKVTLVAKLQQEVKELRKQLEESLRNRDEFNTMDLAERLTVTDAMVDGISKDPEDLRKEAVEQGRLRSLTMERLGGMRKSLSLHGLDLHPDLPYIAKYHDDPSLAFIVHHHLPEDGMERSLGYGDNVHLNLPAWIGVEENSGFIRNVNGRVFLRTAQVTRSNGFRTTSIEVNGTKLRDTNPVELHHLDCIVFGRSLTYYMFKEVCQPEAVVNRIMHQERMKEMGELHDQEIQPLLRKILGEERAADKIQETLAKQYWSYQQTQHYDAEGRRAMYQWLNKAKEARVFVEDANAITEVVRPNYYFELVGIAPVLSFGLGGSNLPEIAVQLLCRMSAAKTRWLGAVTETKRNHFASVAKEVQRALRSANTRIAASSSAASPPLVPGDAGDDYHRELVASFEGLSSSESSSSSSSPRTSPSAPNFGVGGSNYVGSTRWSMGRDSLTSEDGLKRPEAVALWSYQKFRQRLELMYTLKDEWDKDRKGFVLDSSNDAWAEHGPAEITDFQSQADEQLREAKSQLAEANVEIQRLRGLLATANLPASLSRGADGVDTLRDFKAQIGAYPNAYISSTAHSNFDMSPVMPRSAAGQTMRILETAKANRVLLDQLMGRIAGNS